jgi:peroxin-12
MDAKARLGQSSLVGEKGFLTTLRRMLLSSPRAVLDSLKVLLPMSIFFVKFLEWWYSPSSPARSLTTKPTGPPVPPPRVLRPHPHGLSVSSIKYGQCPICQKPVENATALPSGYVFCYKCAYTHVEAHENCPVTLLPSRVWQLRKVLI